MDKVLAVDLLQHLTILDLAIDAFNLQSFNGGKPPVVESGADLALKSLALVASIPYAMYQRYSQKPVVERINEMGVLSQQIQNLCLQYLIKSDSTFVKRTMDYLQGVEQKLQEKCE